MDKVTMLHWSGRIYNFLGKDLVMVGTNGCERCTFPMKGGATIHWESSEYPNQMVQVDDRQICVGNNGEVIGWLNEYFGLVRPTEDTRRLCDFWKQAVAKRRAEVRGMYDPKMFRPKSQEMLVVVVTRGVALTAHYQGLPIKHLMIPAVPRKVVGRDDLIGYEALMPARYVLMGEEYETAL